MSKVIVNAAVSLDGFMALDDDSVGPLFDWYGNGDVAGTLGDPNRVFHTTAASAGYLRSSSFGTPVTTAGGVFGSGGPRALQLAARVTF